MVSKLDGRIIEAPENDREAAFLNVPISHEVKQTQLWRTKHSSSSSDKYILSYHHDWYLDVINDAKNVGLVKARNRRPTALWKFQFINCETNEVESVLDDSGFVDHGEEL